MLEKRVLEHTGKGWFWEIWGDDDTVFIRAGKLAGGPSKLATLVVDDVPAAIERHIARKRGEGYIEKDPPKVHRVAKRESKAPTLLDGKDLKRLLKNITSVEDSGVLVLADWLQQQAHPWGELIALQHGAANGKKAAALVKQAETVLTRHRATILGELAAKRFDAVWDRGFVKQVTLGVPGEAKAICAAVKAFTALPVAHLIDEIALDPSPTSFPTWRESSSSRKHVVEPWTDLESIVAALPARVKRVGFGGWPINAAGAYVEMPTFTAVTKTCAAFTGVGLTGTPPAKLGRLALPAATDLRVCFANASSSSIEALSGAKLPKLERLEVWLGGESHVVVDSVHEPDEWDDAARGLDRYPDTFSAEDLGDMEIYDIDIRVDSDALAALLAGSWSTTLKHLSLGAPKLDAALVGAIAQAPLVARLESVALSGLTDDGATALVSAKQAFSHLASLDLKQSTLGSASVAKVKKALPSALLPKAGAETDPFCFRFVATME